MREKLNENPLAQVAVVGVLLALAGVMVLSSMGGGGGGEAESSTTTTGSASVTTPSGSASVTATVTTPSSGATSAPASVSSVPPVPAPPLPHRVTAAFAANRTVVLLIVKHGGIDDTITAVDSLPLAFARSVSLSVVPAGKIARYVAITQGVKVDRVPALIVVRPKHLDKGIATASVSYGFQTPQSIEQAVVDARYRGRTLSYHP
ncbi:MAG TPA: hypothetical protein VNY83_02965 [Solirubrobacterales bacterium]|jgi:hypothetical protein|nr:hypothetical protein [Solirubrobacterales bacterium]